MKKSEWERTIAILEHKKEVLDLELKLLWARYELAELEAQIDPEESLVEEPRSKPLDQGELVSASQWNAFMGGLEESSFENRTALSYYPAGAKEWRDIPSLEIKNRVVWSYIRDYAEHYGDEPTARQLCKFFSVGDSTIYNAKRGTWRPGTTIADGRPKDLDLPKSVTDDIHEGIELNGDITPYLRLASKSAVTLMDIEDYARRCAVVRAYTEKHPTISNHRLGMLFKVSDNTARYMRLGQRRVMRNEVESVEPVNIPDIIGTIKVIIDKESGIVEDLVPLS